MRKTFTKAICIASLFFYLLVLFHSLCGILCHGKAMLNKDYSH